VRIDVNDEPDERESSTPVNYERDYTMVDETDPGTERRTYRDLIPGGGSGLSSSQLNPFSKESRQGVHDTDKRFVSNFGQSFVDSFKEQTLKDNAHIKRDLFTGGGNVRFDGKGGIKDVSDVPRSMEYYEDVTYDVGGVMSIPGIDKLTGKVAGRESKTTGAYTTGVQGGETTEEKRTRKSGVNTTTKTRARDPGGKLGGYAHAAMLGADASRMIRTGDFGRAPSTDMMKPDAFLKGGGSPVGNRILRSFDVAGIIGSGQPLGIKELPGMKDVSKSEGTPLISGFGDRFKSVGNFFSMSEPVQQSDANRVSQYMAMTEFTKFADHVRSIPDIIHVESDRYYNIFHDPRSEITYIEWKPTEDITNLLKKSSFGSALREWSEDAVAALGMRVPAWHNRVRYVRRKYGGESPSVKHYGYSRGGGLATHFGGTGYGTGYFSSFPPTRDSRSKYSGDKLHDMIINPLSYGLLIRNTVSG
jgi:hypothetical protein